MDRVLEILRQHRVNFIDWQCGCGKFEHGLYVPTPCTVQAEHDKHLAELITKEMEIK